jgi:hypothetical protein
MKFGWSKYNVSLFAINNLFTSAKVSLMQFESGHSWDDILVAVVSCLCALMPLANLHFILIYAVSFCI